MPTYEYVCEKCGHEFELFQSMKEPALEVCPKDVCPRARWGKGKVRRKLGAGAGLIFKGSGFYITDYRSDSYKAAAKKDNGASTGKDGGSGSASSAGTSSKPADKKPAKPDKSSG
jgi:putative FmdB family regulatory protein